MSASSILSVVAQPAFLRLTLVKLGFYKVSISSSNVYRGASGSVAGGIKVNTFAVIIAVVISSIRSRPRAEASEEKSQTHKY
ncbi:MAG: hypothetical protein CM1200mP15_03300 [Dehalococcoidia bacterium]|nr:MAG: hypothetical protein CM1200mP15_03300 [Dehalococcoidia bacterium]